MRKEIHIRNSHKWTRCAMLGLALTMTPVLAAVGTTIVSHSSSTLAAATTTSATSGIHSDGWKWT